jgi:hypothetical protein
MDKCKFDEGSELKIIYSDGSYFTHELIEKTEFINYNLFRIYTTNKEWYISIKEKDANYIWNSHNVSLEHIETIAEFNQVTNIHNERLKELLIGLYPQMSDVWNIDRFHAFYTLKSHIRSLESYFKFK